jgi:hypothetical protein
MTVIVRKLKSIPLIHLTDLMNYSHYITHTLLTFKPIIRNKITIYFIKPQNKFISVTKCIIFKIYFSVKTYTNVLIYNHVCDKHIMLNKK